MNTEALAAAGYAWRAHHEVCPAFTNQDIDPKDQVVGYSGPMALMTARMRLAIPLVASLFASSAVAEEEGPSDVEPFRPVAESYSKFTYRPISIQSRVGIDTLVGLIGLTGSYDIENHLAVGAGFGINTAGLQLAAFARVRPFVWFYHQSTLIALGLEGAYSTGPGRFPAIEIQIGDSPAGMLHWRRINWLQGEVVFELRTHSGFSFTIGTGKAVPIQFQGLSCTGDIGWCNGNSKTKLGTLWTITNGLGYAF